MTTFVSRHIESNIQQFCALVALSRIVIEIGDVEGLTMISPLEFSYSPTECKISICGNVFPFHLSIIKIL